MSGARILYVPIAAAMEANRFAALADWAQVESFDSPGAGGDRGDPAGLEGVAAAGEARLEELGWERYGVVADSHGQAVAIELALRAPDRVDALCIGHAAARYTLSGPAPAMVPAVHDAAEQLLATDYRSFARAITQMTLGFMDDAFVEDWIAAVPHAVARSVLGDLAQREPELASRLVGVPFPVLLGRHRGCVMWTPEAFAAAAERLPEAETVVCDGPPTFDRGFVERIRSILGA